MYHMYITQSLRHTKHPVDSLHRVIETITN